MRLLLDTHLLIWSAEGATPLTSGREAAVAVLVQDPQAELHFSAASIWEVAIKWSRRRSDFTVEPRRLRELLLSAGFREMDVSSKQAARVADLPALHRDPFDRLLIAQAIAERLTLVTADEEIARYPGPIRKV